MNGRATFTAQPPDSAICAAARRPAPALCPALGLAGGMVLSELAGPLPGSAVWGLVLFPLLAGGSLLLLLRHRDGPLARALLMFVVAAAVGLARHQSATRPRADDVMAGLGTDAVLTRLAGEVVQAPLLRPPERRNPFLPFDPPGRVQFVIAVREFRTQEPPLPASGRVRVSVAAATPEAAAPLLKLKLGARIELTGRLYRPRGPRNPGEVDWARWAELQGLSAGLSVTGPEHVRPLPDPPGRSRRALAWLRAVAHNLLLEPYAAAGPEPATADPAADEIERLLDTLVLGQRTAASRELNEAFLRAGATHYLAVSGFNVSVLALAGWWFTRRVFRRGRRTAAVVTLALIAAFAVVAEPNAPILRAAIAGGLACLAVLLARPLCAVNWLALAALLILLGNPRELFRPAFQLSFVQIVALLTLGPWLARRLRPVANLGREAFSGDLRAREAPTLAALVRRALGRRVVDLAAISLVAWCSALPLTLLHFRTLAPWGVLGTFVLSVPVVAITWLSFVTMLLGWIPAVGSLLHGLLRALTAGLLELAGLFTHLPAALLEITPPPVWLVLATYGIVLAALLVPSRPRPPSVVPPATWAAHFPYRFACTAAALVLLWVGWAAWPVAARRGWLVDVLAVGNGNAVLVTGPDGDAAVLDAGTDRNAEAGTPIVAVLRFRRARGLELVCISHENFDHYSGVPELLRRVAVRQLVWNPYFVPAAQHHRSVRRFFALLPPERPAAKIVARGDALTIGTAPIEVLWPPADLDPQTWRPNDRALVLRLRAGRRSILVPGDIERDALRALCAAHDAGTLSLVSDVLIAPHHGSVAGKATAAFLAAVDPELIIVSAAEPRPALRALAAEVLGPDRPVLVTGEVGAMTLHLDGPGPVPVETPFAPNAGRG